MRLRRLMRFFADLMGMVKYLDPAYWAAHELDEQGFELRHFPGCVPMLQQFVYETGQWQSHTEDIRFGHRDPFEILNIADRRDRCRIYKYLCGIPQKGTLDRQQSKRWKETEPQPHYDVVAQQLFESGYRAVFHGFDSSPLVWQVTEDGRQESLGGLDEAGYFRYPTILGIKGRRDHGWIILALSNLTSEAGEKYELALVGT